MIHKVKNFSLKMYNFFSESGVLQNSVLFGRTFSPNCVLFGRTVPPNSFPLYFKGVTQIIQKKIASDKQQIIPPT